MSEYFPPDAMADPSQTSSLLLFFDPDSAQATAGNAAVTVQPITSGFPCQLPFPLGGGVTRVQPVNG